MKIERLEVHNHGERGFSIKLLEWDEYDYLFNIKALGRDFSWGITK